jgi:outer membrane receptor protein involved in Fe transport
MDKIILILTFLLTVTLSFSQNVSGLVMGSDGESLPFVNIGILGESGGTTTDLDGFYDLEISPKGDTLVFSFISFKTEKIFTKGGELNVTLNSEINELEEIVVVAERKTNSEISLIVDKKNSMEVESSLGSKEMSKKGISNVEDGLKKVSGVTFTSNKINVRGLDDRYNQVTLNKVPLPSNNADRKNLDLTLLPKSVVGNIKVKKSYSSNQWSNLAGSQIDLTTGFLKDVTSLGLKLGTSTNGFLPIQSSSVELGRENINGFGFLFTFNQNLNNEIINGNTRLYNKQGNNILNYEYTNNTNNLNISSMLVGKYRIKDFTLSTVSLIVNSNRLEDKVSEGNHFDYSSPILTWRRSPSNHLLFTQQLLTKYKGEKINLNSNLSYSLINSGENNRKQLVYLYDNGYYFNNIDKIDNHTFSSENIQHTFNGNFNFSYEFKNFKPEVGYAYSYTNNKFNYNQEYYDLGLVNNLYPSIDVNNPNSYMEGNVITYNINDPSSLVNGETQINSFYYKNDFNLNKVYLGFGVRGELVNQYIGFRDQVTPIFVREYNLNNFEILPYLNLKYQPNETNQIRLNSSITTIRPRFREMTPFIYTEVFAGSKIQGNPNLTNTTVYNVDLSYEFYPKNGGLFSFTVFGKWINDPIERVNVATASGRLETYQNSQSAYVVGGEIELKKKIKKFTIDYNLCFLFSQINISDIGNSSVIVTNLNRPLQGSTPILSNLDLFYDITNDLSIGLTYNLVGSKLYSVGLLGLGDNYQSVQNFLNLVCNFSVGKFDFTLNINNILYTKFETKQQTDIGNLTIDEYQLPINFRLGLKYKF